MSFSLHTLPAVPLSMHAAAAEEVVRKVAASLSGEAVDEVSCRAPRHDGLNRPARERASSMAAGRIGTDVPVTLDPAHAARRPAPAPRRSCRTQRTNSSGELDRQAPLAHGGRADRVAFHPAAPHTRAWRRSGRPAPRPMTHDTGGSALRSNPCARSWPEIRTFRGSRRRLPYAAAPAAKSRRSDAAAARMSAPDSAARTRARS